MLQLGLLTRFSFAFANATPGAIFSVLVFMPPLAEAISWGGLTLLLSFAIF